MSTMEDVEAAETRMNSAKDALMSYIEKQKAIDRDLHRQLLSRLKKAQAEFLKAIAELGE